MTGRLNRAVASLGGALICFFVLIFLEQYKFSKIFDLLFGTVRDGFANFHSISLILAMMFIVQITHESGLFQFISISLIKLSKAKPILLMTFFCLITLLISAILNNILAVIILIPLTITVSRILNINPSPYILTQAILVNIGGTLFSISSIPNILITTYAKISFIEFFLNVGTLSLVVFVFTLIFFIMLYRRDLVIPRENLDILIEYNVWNFVQNRNLLYKSMISFIVLFSLFIIIPPELLAPDIIAWIIAISLILISRLNPKEIFSKVDLELILYLLGIFIIAGALELSGILKLFGTLISNLGEGDSYILLILILWISALLSSSIDNIPITKVLIPVVGNIQNLNSEALRTQLFYSLAIGANWGDNLTPLGDNILVMNICEQNKRPISFSQFFRLGFFTTIYQLLIITVYFTVVFKPILGIVLIFIISFLIIICYVFFKISRDKYKSIENLFIKVRKFIVG